MGDIIITLQNMGMSMVAGEKEKKSGNCDAKKRESKWFRDVFRWDIDIRYLILCEVVNTE